MYKHGYFTQKINGEGRQVAEYPYLNFYELPITPVHNSAGNRLLVPVELPGRTIYIQVWKAKVGRVCIYLLDADTPRNTTEDRALTGSLYGGDRQCRICQEIILGIGELRPCAPWGLTPGPGTLTRVTPPFWLFNESGNWLGKEFPWTRPGKWSARQPFLPHILPVPAGHDLFSEEMIEMYFAKIAAEMGLDLKGFLELAWDTERNSFNMTPPGPEPFLPDQRGQPSAW